MLSAIVYLTLINVPPGTPETTRRDRTIAITRAADKLGCAAMFEARLALSFMAATWTT